MKQLLLLTLTAFLITTSVHGQTDWKTPLAQSLVQQFGFSMDTAKQLVHIKESYFNQIRYYQMPHVEKSMSREARNKAVAELREKEIQRMNGLLNNEARAKEVSGFLEGKIPTGKGGPRKR